MSFALLQLICRQSTAIRYGFNHQMTVGGKNSLVPAMSFLRHYSEEKSKGPVDPQDADLPTEQRKMTDAETTKYYKENYTKAELLRNIRTNTAKPSPWQKKVLVWTGRYPTEEEVPDEISNQQMLSARDRFRIILNMCMMVFILAMAITITEYMRYKMNKVFEMTVTLEEAKNRR